MVKVTEIQMFGPGPVLGLIITRPHNPDNKKMIESNQDDKNQRVLSIFFILRSQRFHPIKDTQLIPQLIFPVKNRLHYLTYVEIMKTIFFVT